MVLLGGGELDLGDGGDAPRVLHLPRRLLDPLAQHAALAVQPSDLMEKKISIRLSALIHIPC